MASKTNALKTEKPRQTHPFFLCNSLASIANILGFVNYQNATSLSELNIYCLDFIFTLVMLGLSYLTQISYWISFLIH